MKAKFTHKPKAGQLLISEPFLQDENFVRSVVLLCNHDEHGSFGLVLNKLSILKLDELLDGDLLNPLDVYVGGPVEQNTLHFIYRGGQLLEDSISLMDELWWSGDFEKLLTEIRNGNLKEDDVRFFIGYSGWAEGQLQEELDQQTWILCDKIDTENIFDASPEELWKLILKNMGGEYQQMANYPIDPRLN
ncbi:YqgE/AlgH family protein [Mongoliitalea daihaiensis]|uniref:YqgE/AlgH family protein n=1 Tax=Mongoliitalea daihaiensis TaxID=2782006 RepID=UPI001F2E4958|nr:YqgE/AlgH family protein [Mongoliitalea daihaiensis]UJP64090.1 YqgE/AlgH family protein [Mongoliitalea daihaiensis]